MIFRAEQVGAAAGAILAHSVKAGSTTIRKGTVLDAAHIRAMQDAGLTDIIVARLGPEDLTEDAAAHRIGACLSSTGLSATPATTGRVNLIAETPGLIRVDGARIAAMNGLDEALTLATLADYAPVVSDQIVATVKIIPYGVASHIVEQGETALGRGALTLHPFRGGTARLILTRTPGFKDSLLVKGANVVRQRLEVLGFRLENTITVPHETDAVAAVLGYPADLTLILGASATSDRADVAPAAVLQAGGRITRFGMPVDPGNLLFTGEIGGKPVVGLPGCARSPAMNGVDWVLERLAAGLDVTSADIAGMGVGGLLKDVPDRPHPRR